jgi:hypothetical protein
MTLTELPPGTYVSDDNENATSPFVGRQRDSCVQAAEPSRSKQAIAPRLAVAGPC